MITDMASLRAAARSRAGTLRLAVVAATDAASVRAALDARQEGLAEPVLFGNAEAIRAQLEAMGEADGAPEIVPCDTPEAAARAAAQRAGRAEVDVILKGMVSTAAVLHAVLDREHHLRTGSILSDVRIYEHPFQPGRLLGLTDGGVTPVPTREQRRQILHNAVRVFHRLGVARPRVALLAAAEKATEAIPHTVEARTLATELSRDSALPCAVDGPLSFDLAVIPEAARLKGYTSEVAGRAEILVGPNIETINVLAKAVTYLGGVPSGQVVMGARVPVVISSRADHADVKLNSVALAALVLGGHG